MKIARIFAISLLGVLSACGDRTKTNEVAAVPAKPNIIYILADDLGYGDVGAYGQTKIETPNIDALAKEGMLFTQHYASAPVCAPDRYMLMTGLHSGHAYVRGNHEWRERGEVWDYRAMINDSTLEGQIPMPEGTITLAQRLKSNGYNTGMSGKWGLGAPHTNSVPNKMGFDYFIGYNCQRQAHTYYPVHLYENLNRIYLDNDTVAPNTKLPKGADPGDMASYAPYNLKTYAPDRMFKGMMEFVNSQTTDTPFFLYWASPIPHVALQVPQRWVDHYTEKFGKEEPYLGEQGYFPNPAPHATYAAMVSYLDENIGKLVTTLKAKGLYDNTLIIFTSDNGPSYAGGADPIFFESARPFRSEYGRGKGFVYEGGIRVPMIAVWPGKIKPGSVSDHPSVQYDMVATLADVTGYTLDAKTDGLSFAPALLGEEQPAHEFLYWEFPEYGGQVALRMGDWKVVRQNLKNEEKPTLELYNLREDPLEMTNVASEHPEVLKKAAEIFKKEHTQSEVERFRIPILENGLLSDEKPL